jgi:hypothetical protein
VSSWLPNHVLLAAKIIKPLREGYFSRKFVHLIYSIQLYITPSKQELVKGIAEKISSNFLDENESHHNISRGCSV